MRRSSSRSRSAVGCAVIVGEYEVPAIKAIGASVGNDVARFPGFAFGPWMREQECAATAVDTDDFGFWRDGHQTSMADIALTFPPCVW